MNQLEQLLNTLIERGWKPFGHEYVSVEHLEELVRFYYEDKKSCIETLRTITCKESGLWQFVCENGMYNSVGIKYSYFCNTSKINYGCNSYVYRLIESALEDESELEDFLLDNIKVGND